MSATPAPSTLRMLISFFLRSTVKRMSPSRPMQETKIVTIVLIGCAVIRDAGREKFHSKEPASQSAVVKGLFSAELQDDQEKVFFLEYTL